MEDQKPTSFTFEIDNFSEKETLIESPTFSSGGCKWSIDVHPKGDRIDDHLSLYLFVANSESLRLGWKRRADYSIFLLNQSGKELSRTSGINQLFCAEFPGDGTAKAVPLKKLQEKGFLENNKLIVKAEVKVLEVVDEGVATENEMLDYKGFKVLYSQVISVSRLLADHPDIALNVRSKNQVVKTAYMNILLGLIETLNKPPHSLTEPELEKAQSEFMELTEAGFKLDWLKKNIGEITLEGKKAITDDSRVRQLEEHIENLKVELDNDKIKSAAKVSSLEKKVSYLKVKSTTSDANFLSLEEKVSNLKTKLKMTKKKVSDLKVKLDNEKVKSTTSDAKVLSLEKTVSDLKVELDNEKVKSTTSNAKVLSLEEEFLDLKVELDNEKVKSTTSNAKVLSFEEEFSDLKVELDNERLKSTTSNAKVLALEEEVSNLKTMLAKNRKKLMMRFLR